MGQLVSVVMFGLGAALGLKAVKAVGGGLRPVLVQVVKGGMIAGEAAQSLVSRAGRAAGEATAELRRGAQEATASPPPGQPPPPTGPRKIEIAKE